MEISSEMMQGLALAWPDLFGPLVSVSDVADSFFLTWFWFHHLSVFRPPRLRLSTTNGSWSWISSKGLQRERIIFHFFPLARARPFVKSESGISGPLKTDQFEFPHLHYMRTKTADSGAERNQEYQLRNAVRQINFPM